MKKILLAMLFISLLNAVAVAHDSQVPLVKITLKNAAHLPKRVTIISYQPGDTVNGTEQLTMLPKSTKELTFREGTKVYLADAKQVNLVMSGKRIDQDKPFLIVKKEDTGKTFTY